MSDLRDYGNDLYDRGGPFLRRLWEELLLAISLLTRISIPRFEVTTGATIGSAFWAYPIAGAIVGLVGGGAFVVGETIGFGAYVSALLALAAMTLFSGGIHEDGLADFFDGLGGKSQIERLQIMRDSRIGSFGVLALIFFVGLCAAFLFDISRGSTPVATAALIVCVAAVARTAVGIPLALMEPVRAEGLSVAAQRPPIPALIVGSVLVVLLCVLLLGVAKTIFLIVGASAGAFLMSGWAYRMIGGHTGDVLGAVASAAMLFGVASLSIVGRLP